MFYDLSGYASGATITYSWDFDDNVDSDGDGNAANDNDASERDPAWLFPLAGLYNVTLTITESGGATDSINYGIVLQ